ncbi:MAG: energy transducer TonB [Terracidiphilus sp.]
MFEDSTFESTGRIKTRSRRWMFAACALNGSILVALVLVPLIYPNALPSHMMPSLLVAPAAPQPETPPPAHVRAVAPHDFAELENGRITAPPRIPTTIRIPTGPEQPFTGPNIALDSGTGTPGGDGSPFGVGRPVTVVHPPAPSSIRLPSKFVEGFLIYKSIPQYPIIAKSVGVQGTVVLQATISKSGTIENLQAVSGPQMLQQAAIEAVKNWRYRPYLLNDQPVEVETTVNVIFRLER